jgi:hypothetical protein
MPEPTTREEIEAFLKAKYEAGEAETGLFSTGPAYVVMDRVDDAFTFEWFDAAYPLDALIHPF